MFSLFQPVCNLKAILTYVQSKRLVFKSFAIVMVKVVQLFETIRVLPSFIQKIVPSLSISIGGPPVSGRLSFAISRPPFQVAPSNT